MTQRIAMLGTGANGSCIAADLTRAGFDVTIIDQWPAHVEAMRRQGLRISMPEEEVHTAVRAHHITDLRALNATFDVVLLTPKAYDTRWMCELIKPYLADDGLLIGIQNAMTVDDIGSIVGPERTMGCVIELSSQLFEPAHVSAIRPPRAPGSRSAVRIPQPRAARARSQTSCATPARSRSPTTSCRRSG